MSALSSAEIEAIARRVAELLSERRGERETGLATAAEVAARLGVHPSWVYANQERLGAIRLGDGPRARLRFDLERATEAVGASRARRPARRPAGRPRQGAALPAGIELLRGRRASRR